MEFEIEICDKCTKSDFNFSCVPVENKKLCYNEFFKNYMYPNVPCVIKDVTETWEANAQWVTDHKPNLNFLRDKYGSCDVTIYNCNERYFNSQKTETCKFETFLDTHWANNKDGLKYLKDWHLKNTFKNDDFYQVPIYFASDWLNEFLTEHSEDDYRFVYMGQAGTWTPFHADVFNSYSWSANVCGRKKWVLFPPREENYLRDSLNNLPYDISEVSHNRRHLELIQNPGEAIFVPSGWYHQVWNLEDTISINHNWINGCNIDKMWTAVKDNLNCVKKEIEDCQDMDDFLQHCQTMLNASFGMDFFKFYDFIQFIGTRRLSYLESNTKSILFHGHILGKNHAIFDLKAVKTLLENFVEHEDVAELFSSQNRNPRQFLEEISEFLKKTFY